MSPGLVRVRVGVIALPAFWVLLEGGPHLVRQRGFAVPGGTPSRLVQDVVLGLDVEVLAIPDCGGFRYAFDGFGGYWAPTKEACEAMIRFFASE